jgi:endoglucanase
MNQKQIARLQALLALPTAPFREQHIRRHAAGFLEHHGVPHFEDPLGNIVVGAASRRAYERLLRNPGSQPLRLFIAHMDHPGFHGERWLSAHRLAVRWHGGSPVKHLVGARLRVADDAGTLGGARLSRARAHARGWGIDRAELVLPRTLFAGRRRPAARSLFGGFAFRAPVWLEGDLLYCPAADDLVGVFAVLETARRLWRRAPADPPFIGLLTRAEEVGFVGAVGHLELGWLARRRRDLVAVSLEASRTLPGADIGKGPIVRLGDHRTVFSPDGLRVLSEAARRHLEGAHQRRIMDGGSCEATAMTAWGLPSIGLSVPLGNYHNQGFQGGPDCRGKEGPAPEFVSIGDVEGLLRLCAALMRDDLPWGDPWRQQRVALRKILGKYRGLL